MVELGLAIAWEKPVFLVRDDFRCCIDSEGYPLNLMLFTGLPEMGWDAYWYSSAQEIADPDKVPSRWLKDGVRNHYVRERVVVRLLGEIVDVKRRCVAVLDGDFL